MPATGLKLLLGPRANLAPVRTNLAGVMLAGANLQSAVLRGMEATAATFDGANLHGAVAYDLNAPQASFVGADLTLLLPISCSWISARRGFGR